MITKEQAQISTRLLRQQVMPACDLNVLAFFLYSGHFVLYRADSAILPLFDRGGHQSHRVM
jgi:hypothetical protein